MVCLVVGHRRNPVRKVQRDGEWWSECRFCDKPMIHDVRDRRWRLAVPRDGESPLPPRAGDRDAVFRSIS